MKKRHVLSLLLFLLPAVPVSAQTWQWITRGGSPSDPSGGNTFVSRERVQDMTTDPNGNIYLISPVTSSSASLGTVPIATYSSASYYTSNLVLASYTCSGTLRWHKTIGASDVSAEGCAVRTDKNGHVYVMGRAPFVQYNSAGQVAPHFDTDTVLPFGLMKRFFIIQYDTSGNYKWLRMPDADTLSVNGANKSSCYDMAVDAAGNLNAVVWLTHGALAGTPYAVPTNSLYVLKYNQQGGLISAIHPPGFNFAYYSTPSNPSTDGFAYVGFESFCLTPTPSGGWLLSGEQTNTIPLTGFSIGGQTIGQRAFVASFNSQWQPLWQYSPGNESGILGRAAIDTSGNIYLAGFTERGASLFGQTVQTATNDQISLPYVAKLRGSDGSLIWLNNASHVLDHYLGCAAVTKASNVILKENGELVTGGACVGMLWGGRQIAGRCNTGYGPFLARFNCADGSAVSLDSIPRTPSSNDCGVSALVSGRNNAVIAGGYVSGALIAGGTAQSAGGQTDFFLSRYGWPCNCAAPVAAFSRSTGNASVQLHFTGATAGTDSLRWNFGDGQALSQTGAAMTSTFTHTYAAGGTYTICLRTYGSCGTGDSCASITVSRLGTGDVRDRELLQLHPNPAHDQLQVTAAPGSTFLLYDAAGRVLRKIVLEKSGQAVSVKDLPAGLYLASIVTGEGRKVTQRLRVY